MTSRTVSVDYTTAGVKLHLINHKTWFVAAWISDLEN